MSADGGLAVGPDGLARCRWGVSAPDYVAYHDEEWDRPVTDDRGIYERLTLEAFKSGLSWLTILRNRAKVEAAIANARAAREMAAAGESLAAVVWSFRLEHEAAPTSFADVPAATPESTALAKELKKRGFRFVGPTTAYALMQATGIANDHLAGCTVRDAVEAERRLVT